MANLQRGEVEFRIGDDVYIVAMGLGTLAELESAFGVESFEDALAKLFGADSGKISAGNMLTFARCVLKGSGVSIPKGMDADLLKMQPADFIAFTNALLASSGLAAQAPATEGGSSEAPLGGASAGSSGASSDSATSA